MDGIWDMTIGNIGKIGSGIGKVGSERKQRRIAEAPQRAEEERRRQAVRDETKQRKKAEADARVATKQREKAEAAAREADKQRQKEAEKARLASNDSTTGDSFGTRKANPKLLPAEGRKPGSNTKAADQLKSAAAQAARGGDLTKNYDEGGARNAGTLTAHTLSAGASPMDLSHFSKRAKEDPEIIASLKILSALQAKRSGFEIQRTKLTKERNLTKDAALTKTLTERLTQEDKKYQTTLVEITKTTEAVEKQRRAVDLTVGKPSS